MYTFVLMFIDLFKNQNLHYFMLFFIFIFVRWGVVYFNAIKYKPYKYDGDKKFNTSVIIPVVDEPLDLFNQVLTRIASQDPSEIIVVINGPKNEGLEQCVQDFTQGLQNSSHSNVLMKCYYTSIAGKRNAVRVGMKHTMPDSDIAVLVDSDTVWTENTLSELVKPFACDEKIGGVTTRQKILDPNRNLITMFANLLEEIRAEGSMKAMSYREKVGCLPGRTIAFRTSILRKSMYEFMHEEFMGIHKEVSDDRSLTNLTLKAGYKTVMQDTSVVYTDAPVKWKKFIRQQFRWSEGSQYNNLRMTPWMFKNAKLMCFIYWTDMLMPMLLISVYVNALICIILNHCGVNIATINYTGAIYTTIALIILGCIFSFGARNIKVMSNLQFRYTLLIPVFIFVLTIIMVPVRLIGLSKCADGMGWGTRQLTEEGAA